jgi:beta-glucosidase
VAVTFTVENSGSRPGAEVAQVYVGFPESAGEPPKQLKGFHKLLLGKGRASTVSLTLDPRAFAYWDSSQHAWVVAPGSYEILVGSSSRDIRLRAQVTLPGGRLGA